MHHPQIRRSTFDVDSLVSRELIVAAVARAMSYGAFQMILNRTIFVNVRREPHSSKSHQFSQNLHPHRHRLAVIKTKKTIAGRRREVQVISPTIVLHNLLLHLSANRRN